MYDLLNHLHVYKKKNEFSILFIFMAEIITVLSSKQWSKGRKYLQRPLLLRITTLKRLGIPLKLT